MPSLKGLIIDDGKSIYSVDINKLLDNGFVFEQYEIIRSPHTKQVFYGKTVYVDYRFVPDKYEHLRGSHEICELILRPPGIDWQRRLSEKLAESNLPLVSTFANLEKVIIANECLHAWDRDERLINSLNEMFQFPSVIELHFETFPEIFRRTRMMLSIYN